MEAHGDDAVGARSGEEGVEECRHTPAALSGCAVDNVLGEGSGIPLHW